MPISTKYLANPYINTCFFVSLTRNISEIDRFTTFGYTYQFTIIYLNCLIIMKIPGSKGIRQWSKNLCTSQMMISLLTSTIIIKYVTIKSLEYDQVDNSSAATNFLIPLKSLDVSKHWQKYPSLILSLLKPVACRGFCQVAARSSHKNFDT